MPFQDYLLTGCWRKTVRKQLIVPLKAFRLFLLCLFGLMLLLCLLSAARNCMSRALQQKQSLALYSCAVVSPIEVFSQPGKDVVTSLLYCPEGMVFCDTCFNINHHKHSLLFVHFATHMSYPWQVLRSSVYSTSWSIRQEEFSCQSAKNTDSVPVGYTKVFFSHFLYVIPKT